MKATHWILAAWVAVVFALHQDVWNWHKASPLLFGLLPPGLVYHLGYSILAAFTMALLVKFAWPRGLDPEASAEPAPGPPTHRQQP
jgi:hypothetical protein